MPVSNDSPAGRCCFFTPLTGQAPGQLFKLPTVLDWRRHASIREIGCRLLRSVTCLTPTAGRLEVERLQHFLKLPSPGLRGWVIAFIPHLPLHPLDKPLHVRFGPAQLLQQFAIDFSAIQFFLQLLQDQVRRIEPVFQHRFIGLFRNFACGTASGTAACTVILFLDASRGTITTLLRRP